MKKYSLIILTLIIFLGLLLRIYNLSSIPAGFFCDEASTGLNAFYILKTGHDEFGKTLPVLFESFGNFRPGIPFYFTVPLIAIFGLNELSTRLAAALIGTASILALYFLVKMLFKSEKIALLSAFFLAISPWHIHFSRYGAENIYLPFFIILATFAFLKGLSSKNKYIYLSSFIVFGLGLYTYFHAYYLIPLFMMFLIILYRKQINKNNTLLGIIIFFILSIPLIIGIASGEALGRLTQVSSANENKNYLNLIVGMIETYKNHFLPEFLFSKGDIGYHTHFITRFSVRNFGELYWFQLPFILFSFIWFKKFKSSYYIIIFWLLVYPLGSTIAPFADGGGPFATRSIIGVVPFQILTAIGIVAFFSYIKNRIIKIILILLLIIIIGFSLTTYINEYFKKYPLYSSDFWGWQYGPKEILSYFLINQNNYDELIMSYDFNAPEVFPKFYLQDKCYKCSIGLPHEKFDSSKNQLFSVTPEYIEKNSINFITLKNIYYPSGKVAFKIGKIVE